MVDNTSEALREIADMIDNLKEVCRIESRNELEAIRNRLRHLAARERPIAEAALHLHDEKSDRCDVCGSHLVWRGRNPSVLRCPLECESDDGGL